MNGILLVDKPSCWTSNDVVCKLKGVLHEKRVGHSGTLDPMATGLLTVFAGRATRAVSYAENNEKRYSAALRPGIVTDTLDISGTILEENKANFTEEDFIRVISGFKGEIQQIPPMYSAIKIDGRKLYELARKGEVVERQPRKVTIKDIQYKGKNSEGDYQLDVVCSKGTYIRSLCDDIGKALGCGAAMSALRRTAAGVFSVNDAYTLEEIIAAGQNDTINSMLLPVDALFADYPAAEENAANVRKILVGNSYRTEFPDGTYRVYGPDGAFLMLGSAESGYMKTVKSFFEVS